MSRQGSGAGGLCLPAHPRTCLARVPQEVGSVPSLLRHQRLLHTGVTARLLPVGRAAVTTGVRAPQLWPGQELLPGVGGDSPPARRPQLQGTLVGSTYRAQWILERSRPAGHRPLSIPPGTHPLFLSREGTEILPGMLSAVGSATTKTPGRGAGGVTPADIFPCVLGASEAERGPLGQPPARGDRDPAASPGNLPQPLKKVLSYV